MAVREGERVEFAEAKERLKASWAVDREDFARVKDQLKKKNAEHHVQNGRLSQSLKVGTLRRRPLPCIVSKAGACSAPWTLKPCHVALVPAVAHLLIGLKLDLACTNK